MGERIQVKAMVIALNDEGTAHAVSVNGRSGENPDGFHRLIGGSVALGETHHDAALREAAEELGAKIRDLVYLGCLENIFRMDGQLGHEIVFLYAGRLDPQPPPAGATMTETDGLVMPVVWRGVEAGKGALPLYPAEVQPFVEDAAARLRGMRGERERCALDFGPSLR